MEREVDRSGVELKSFTVRIDDVPAVGRHRVELLWDNGRLVEAFDHRRRAGAALECVEIPAESRRSG